MLLRLLTSTPRSFPRNIALAGALSVACSFYTDCPCANQPTPKPGTGGTTATGGAGAGTGGATGGTTGGVGGSGLVDAGGASGMGDAGAGTGGTMPTGSWIRATGNLANRSAACGNITFMSAKPDENLLIAGVRQLGLWGSRDGGQNWEALGAGNKSALIDNIVSTLLYDPDDSDTFWEVGIYGPGFFRTTDDGENFEQVGSIQHNDYVSIDWSDPDRQLMLAGGHEAMKTLYRTVDGGSNWDAIGDTIPETCRWSSYPLIVDADTYLLGCWNGIFRTTDAGQSWDSVSSYGGASVPLITSEGVIYWTIETMGGLVRSDDGGDTWERVVGGGVISAAQPIELPDGTIATISGTRVVSSDDGGLSWDPLTPTLPFTPSGLVYSEQEHAFFVWQSTCETNIPKDAMMRLDYEF